MNFTRNILRYSRIFGNLNVINSQKTLSSIENGLINIVHNRNKTKKEYLYGPLLCGVFSFFKKDEETAEEKLVTTIKRSILCIQKEEYVKAEQMLHLALRMAQDMQNRDGITYIYDIMANLAMEQEQFQKAEKLFTDVMRRLFSDGHAEDSIKILHISSKIAHMSQLQGHYDKAMQGFTWTLGKIEQSLKNLPDDKEIQQLWGLTRNWFGQLLMEQGKYDEAKKCFLDALQIYSEAYGKLNTEAITMLNNLSVACSNLGDTTGAKKFLEEALQLSDELPEIAEYGILKANLGLLYLKDGMLQQAREICSTAWKWGKKADNEAAVKQSEYCLEKIKELMSN